MHTMMGASLVFIIHCTYLFSKHLKAAYNYTNFTESNYY